MRAGAILWLALWGLATAGGGSECMGQNPAGARAGGNAPQTEAAESIFMPAERSLLMLLDRTHLLIDEGRYAEAVRCLDTILGGTEDYFFKPDRDAPVHRSLKSEARRLLGSMPSRGLESYELQYGAIARRGLNEAVESGNIDLVAEVARRYFHTVAGYEATYLVGVHHMDQGRPLVAALTFRRLRDEAAGADRFEPSLSLAMAGCWLKAGMAEAAREALASLRNRYSAGSVKIEGRQVALFRQSDDPADWLSALLGEPVAIDTGGPRDWAMRRGWPQRNARASGGPPLLNVRWRVPTTDQPEIEQMIRSLQQQQEERELALLPGLHPLVVGNVVLMRTATNLLAVDFETGKRLWEVPADDPFDATLNPPPEGRFALQGNLTAGLRLRLWGDATYGTLSSDGHLVFAVEDLQLPSASSYARVLLAPGRVTSPPGAPTAYNRLAAYDLRSEGKLRWQLGGDPVKGRLPLAGAFFLGPPLPLLGDLYAIAEIDGEIRLLAIDAASGGLVWQQQLAVVEQGVLNDPLRRVAGVSPSYADGVLVCPTSNRSIVAIELTTRSLLWGYSYAEQEMQNQRAPNLFGAIRHRNPNPEQRWVDSSLVVADGRIVATPVDSDRLHCLDLHTGRLLWEAPRDDKLLVAGACGGKVFVLGHRGLYALGIDDGKPAWSSPLAACPEGAKPSGEGFFSDTHYYLPLTSGQVMAIELASGEAAPLGRSRPGLVLGNLVCHRGRVLSQQADRIESFHELDWLLGEIDRRLAADANDPRALALRGEVLWNDGRLDEAADCLRRSLAATETIHARSMLRSVLFEGLEVDFARYRDRQAEVAELLDSDDERAAFHRLMAMGWEGADRPGEALAHYRQLVALDRTEPISVRLDENHRLRQDRWIQMQLRQLHAAAPAAVRAELAAWSSEEFRQASEKPGPDAIGEALGYFDGLPEAAAARSAWAERLIQNGRLTDAELVLAREAGSDDRQAAGGALARWAAMLVDAGRGADAAVIARRLETDFASVPVSAGQTGNEWARALREKHGELDSARQAGAWPAGRVRHSSSPAEAQTLPSYGRWVIPEQQSRGPFLDDLTIELHQQPLRLVARDGLGRRKWELPLDEIADQGQLALSRSLMRIDACGHLLILSLGNMIVALDALRADEKTPPKVAWQQPIEALDPETLRQQLSQLQMQSSPGWLGAPRLGGAAGYSFGTAVVLGDGLICLKRSRACAALDPASGEELWRRENISSQSTVFGDGQFVLIAPPRSTTAAVLRASDGRQLGLCTVPPEEQRLATVGRCILTWQGKGRGYELAMIDPWKEGKRQTVWGPRQFEIDAKVQIVDHQAVAVYSAGGRFTIFRLSDGEPIVDEQLAAERELTDILVLRRAGRYVLIANNAIGRENASRRISQVAGVMGRRIGQAKVYAFDAGGKRLWKQPLAVSDQYLPLVQPSAAPCLTFASMVQQYVPNQQNQAQTNVLCVDVRTGAKIFEDRFEGPSHTFDIIGNAENSTIVISMQQRTLTLKFTDEPLPQPRDAENQQGEPKTAGRMLEAIWRAVLEGAARDPAAPRGDDGQGAEDNRGQASKANAPQTNEQTKAAHSNQEGLLRNGPGAPAGRETRTTGGAPAGRETRTTGGAPAGRETRTTGGTPAGREEPKRLAPPRPLAPAIRGQIPPGGKNPGQ